MSVQSTNVEREVLQPRQRRRKATQVAALCYRGKGARRRILLVTSRDTGRWILPKGWLIDGLDGPGSARQEAWEEAGVRAAKVSDCALGSFRYNKRLDCGAEVPVIADVYKLKVDRLEDNFPEARERKRTWVRPREAADMVDEPELRKLLQAL